VTRCSERFLMFTRPARAQHAVAAHTPAVLRLDAQRAVVAAPAPGRPPELQAEVGPPFAGVGRGAARPAARSADVSSAPPAAPPALAAAGGPVRLHGRGLPAPQFRGNLVHRGSLPQGDPAAAAAVGNVRHDGPELVARAADLLTA